MKFKTEQNEIWYFESVEEMKKFYKGQGGKLTPITEEEAQAILVPPLTPEQKKQRLIRLSTQIAEEMVQSVIDDYNETHNVEFKNIDSIGKYLRNSAYPHHQFIKDVTDWVVGTETINGLFQVVRSVQDDVIAGNIPRPSKSEFISMLPQYSGVR